MRAGAIRYVALGLVLVPAAQAGEPKAATIPWEHTSALNGEVVDLPASLKDKPTVLVVGFSQGSRGEVTAWGKRLAAEFQDSATVRFYEVSMLAGVPKFLRGLVLKKIAADVPDLAKPHFLAIEDHEPEWRAVAGYRKAEDAYVLVVDGGGQVRWRMEGPATEASYQQLKVQVGAIRPGP